jgi:hypothetical protein
MSYKIFEDDDIVRGNPAEVTTGLWTGDVGILSGSTFFTSSTQFSASGKYYISNYSSDPNTNTSAEIQFDVSYGNADGGGAPTLNDDNYATLPTKATYTQYRNMLLTPDDTYFTFLGNYSSHHIYVVNIERARLRETLDPGNWALSLSGSRGVMTFIDDSNQTLDPSSGKAGRVFNIVSGALTGISGSTIYASQSLVWGGYGLVYPDVGVMILNPNAISESVGLISGAYVGSGSLPYAPVTGAVSPALNQYNHIGLYNSIKLAKNFQARSAESISSTHYFARVRNKEFNYSNNPSFYNQTNGNILISDFVNSPRSYVTTVGLYNDNNELLAVAKLSKPYRLGFDREALFKIRLDF